MTADVIWNMTANLLIWLSTLARELDIFNIRGKNVKTGKNHLRCLKAKLKSVFCCCRFCNKTFFHGYSVKDGIKKFEVDVLTGKILISSSQTAFSIPYLYDVTLQILHSNASFQALADIFQSLHIYNKHSQFRADLNRKRLSNGWFLYSYLELSSRYGFNPEFNVGEFWLENSINNNYNRLKLKFSATWAGHKCLVPFCESMMVTDGGFKINRPVCAAKFSVIREYTHSDKRVLTGCTNMPSPDSKFCHHHRSEQSPVILKETLSTESRTCLYNFRSRTKQTQLRLPDDDLFVVESILEVRMKNKTKQFLVQWAGFPRSEATWEPMKNIPHLYNKVVWRLGKTWESFTGAKNKRNQESF